MEGKKTVEWEWMKYLLEHSISEEPLWRNFLKENVGVLSQTRLKLIVDRFHIEN